MLTRDSTLTNGVCVLLYVTPRRVAAAVNLPDRSICLESGNWGQVLIRAAAVLLTSRVLCVMHMWVPTSLDQGLRTKTGHIVVRSPRKGRADI